MEIYSFKVFLDPNFEPSDYVKKSGVLGTVAFWTIVAIIGIGVW